MNRFALSILAISLGLAGCGGGSSLIAPNPQLPVSERAQSGDAATRAVYGHLVKQGKSTKFKLNVQGGKFRIPDYAGFKGESDYTPNNAPAGATLTVTNSGNHNVLGAGVPPNQTPVLYMEASLNAKSAVAFKNYAEAMTIKSASLQSGTLYEVDIYAGNDQLLSYPAYGTPQNGKLSFPSPFAGISISPGSPITIEVVPPSPETLYVSCYNCEHSGTPGIVWSYDANTGAQTGSRAVPDAFALGVDDSQDLYVTGCYCQNGTNPFAEEYFPSGGYYTYTNNVTNPYGVVALAGASPAFHVINLQSPELLTFQEQQVNQSATYNDPNLQVVYSVTSDAASNTYVGGINTAGTGWEVDYLETNIGTFNLGLKLSETPYSLALDQKGNLLVAEPKYGVAIFPPGQTTNSEVIDPGGDTASIAFGNGGTWLFVLDGSDVKVYSYPEAIYIADYQLSYTTGTVAISPRVPLFNPNLYRAKHRNFKYWSDLLGGRRSGSIPLMR